jgi:HEAT repeat protein
MQDKLYDKEVVALKGFIMIEIHEHDSRIKAFLQNGNVQKAVLCNLSSETNQKTFRHLISTEWSQSDSIKNKNLAIFLRVDDSTIANFVKPEINTALQRFSKKYDIDPPIQLYFRTKRFIPAQKKDKDQNLRYSNVGAHLACTCTLDKNTSCAFISIEQLENNLKQALSTIKHQSDNLLMFQTGQQAKTLTENDLVEEFRKKLKRQAIDHLKEKLHGNALTDYRELNLQIGILNHQITVIPEHHNRIWEDFDSKELEQPQNIFILSSETGSGKTTFLRNLQLKIIDKTNLIPLFIEASSLDSANFPKRDTEAFLGFFLEIVEKDESKRRILETLLDRIIFLIDGLDQIAGSGSAYRILVDNLFSVIKRKIIISSRPFAVIDLEKDSKIKFLKLRPFSEGDLETYFSDKHDYAKKICKTCPEMLHIPMLAYMVRTFIKDGNHKLIKHRTEIFKVFVNYIFKEYHHQNLRLSEEKIFNIRKAYGEISFKSIDHVNPYIQKIPLEFAIDCKETDVEIDELFKCGITHTIANMSHGIEKFLYFSHQSFQEYLAAEYISKSNDRVQQVLSEKWNPKWKEVIKFLTGLKGQLIIENILSEKDNMIHSKLFLSSELAQETEIDYELKKKISIELESLFEHPIYCKEAEICMSRVDVELILKKYLRKLKDNNCDIRILAINFLIKLVDKTNRNIINDITPLIDDKNSKVRDAAIIALAKHKDKLSINLQSLIAEWSNHENWSPFFSKIPISECEGVIEVDVPCLLEYKLKYENDFIYLNNLFSLAKSNDKVDIDPLKNFHNRFNDKYNSEYWPAIYFLANIQILNGETLKKLDAFITAKDSFLRRIAIFSLGKLDENTEFDIQNKVANCLHDQDSSICVMAINTLKRLGEKLHSEFFNNIVNKLGDPHSNVKIAVLHTIGCFQDRISKDIQNQIANHINNENSNVRTAAIVTLGKLDNVTDSTLKRIADRLDDKNRTVRYAALCALGNLRNTVDSKIQCKIAKHINNKDYCLCFKAISTLGNLENKIDDKILKKIVDSLNKKDVKVCHYILSALKNFKDNVDSKILNKIIDLLNDEDSYLCKIAINTLVQLKDKLDDQSVKKIILFNSMDVYFLLKSLYSINRLNEE